MPRDPLEDLNTKQREAVTYLDGPALIIAGAGSGKTRVIGHRIVHLMADKHESPRAILAVTFTNKAAEEMKSRVLTLLDRPSLPFLWIGTFHSICARILRADVEALKGPHTRNFTILDADEAAGLVRRILRDRGISEKNFQPKAVLGAISRAKLSGVSAQAYASRAATHAARTIAPVYSAYQARLSSSNVMDFDDLLLLAVKLLESSEEVLRRYQDRFRHVLVDEYQDTSRIQYRLLRLLAGGRALLFAVGDEDQSIYRWRGADIQNIMDFQRDFPGARVIKLERNYRSTKAILDAANGLIAKNTQRLGKKLWTEKRAGPPVRVYAAPSDREEASFVVDTFRRLRRDLTWGDMAVLTRTNAQSRTFEEACLNRGIPYQVVGGMKFYERKEVKDLIAYLRLILNPRDRVALLRVLNVPPRGIGKVTLERLEALASERGVSLLEGLGVAATERVLSSRTTTAVKGFLSLLEGGSRRLQSVSPAELTEWVLSETAYFSYLAEQSRTGPDPETRIENVRELVSAMREFEMKEGGDLRSFLERQALASDQDDLGGENSDSVKLMTLHSAKGLEFPVVVLAGLEEGLFPHVLSSGSEDGMEEERRLCYVGMTRAREILYLTWARKRYVFGVAEERLPSLFLRDIPGELVESEAGVSASAEGIGEAAALLSRPRKSPDVSALRVGSRVHHRTFGFGIVLGTEGNGDKMKVTVSFNRVGRKKLLAGKARLEAV